MGPRPVTAHFDAAAHGGNSGSTLLLLLSRKVSVNLCVLASVESLSLGAEGVSADSACGPGHCTQSRETDSQHGSCGGRAQTCGET